MGTATPSARNIHFIVLSLLSERLVFVRRKSKICFKYASTVTLLSFVFKMKFLTLFYTTLSFTSLCSAGRSHSARHRSLHNQLAKKNTAIFTTGDPDEQGPGLILENNSTQTMTYYMYENQANGDGWGVPNFDSPYKYITMPPSLIAYVYLPTSFKGRVQRGTDLPATWVEYQISADNDNCAHGDISLEQGYDGAATISADGDDNDDTNGFEVDLFNGAPEAAYQNKPDGSKALATTMGNWMSGPNSAAIDWENEKIGQSKAYITGGTGVPDVKSCNQRLYVKFL